MERAPHIIKITKELPKLKDKNYISFLTNEELIIQGKGTWDIIDSKTHKVIATLNDTPNPAKIDIHPNHKTFMIFGKNTIKIYDTKTKKLLNQYLSQQEIKYAQLDRLNNNIVYIIKRVHQFNNFNSINSIIKRDYHSQINQALCELPNYDKLFTHPIAPSLCYFNEASLCHTDHNNILMLPFPPTDIFYNPDGSVIIARNVSKIITIDPFKLQIDKRLQCNTMSEYFENVKMYSNNILVLLATTKGRHYEYLYLKFYNITDLLSDFQRRPNSMFDPQPQPVAQTEKIEINIIWNRELHIFSFSPNGKQCMIGFNDKALLFDIPFEIIYAPEAKERLSHLLFVLKNYEMQLPSDLLKLLTQTSLKTYKR